MQRLGLSLCRKIHLSMFCLIASGVMNLKLNSRLIPKYNYIVASTTLVSYVFLVVLMIVVSQGFFVWEFPSKSLVKVAYAPAINGCHGLLMGRSLTPPALINLILGIFVRIIVCTTVLFVLREPHEEEIQTLQIVRIKALEKLKWWD